MFLPSPLVGQGGSRRLPDEGCLSTESCLSVDATPHRGEFVVGVGVALSHKGRGRSNGYPLPLWERAQQWVPSPLVGEGAAMGPLSLCGRGWQPKAAG